MYRSGVTSILVILMNKMDEVETLKKEVAELKAVVLELTRRINEIEKARLNEERLEKVKTAQKEVDIAFVNFRVAMEF